MPRIPEEAEKRSLSRGWSVNETTTTPIHREIPIPRRHRCAEILKKIMEMGNAVARCHTKFQVQIRSTDREREKRNFRVGWTVNEITTTPVHLRAARAPTRRGPRGMVRLERDLPALEPAMSASRRRPRSARRSSLPSWRGAEGAAALCCGEVSPAVRRWAKLQPVS